MGKINNELNSFFQNNQEFADLINLHIYHGKTVICPEMIPRSAAFFKIIS